MGGIDPRDGVLVVEREANRLDELAIEFSEILDRFGIDHVSIAGDVSVLAGRTRSIEDVTGGDRSEIELSAEDENTDDTRPDRRLRVVPRGRARRRSRGDRRSWLENLADVVIWLLVTFVVRVVRAHPR